MQCIVMKNVFQAEALVYNCYFSNKFIPLTIVLHELWI